MLLSKPAQKSSLKIAHPCTRHPSGHGSAHPSLFGGQSYLAEIERLLGGNPAPWYYCPTRGNAWAAGRVWGEYMVRIKATIIVPEITSQCR